MKTIHQTLYTSLFITTHIFANLGTELNKGFDQAQSDAIANTAKTPGYKILIPKHKDLVIEGLKNGIAMGLGRVRQEVKMAVPPQINMAFDTAIAQSITKINTEEKKLLDTLSKQSEKTASIKPSLPANTNQPSEKKIMHPITEFKKTQIKKIRSEFKLLRKEVTNELNATRNRLLKDLSV